MQDQQDIVLDKRFRLTFAILAVVSLLVALDGSSISVALPIVAKKLNGTAIEAFWVGTSFLLCSTVFQPCFGSLSNSFGRKPLMTLALLFFLVGAIVAGASNEFMYLILGRSLQGVGGGGIVTLIEIVITDLVPLRLRGQYFGFIATMLSIGAVMGPILGGGFSQNVSWRWIFYINLPFAGLALFMIPVTLKGNHNSAPLKDKLQRIDYIGALLFIASTTICLMPITWGGVVYAWGAVQTFCPLVLGATGVAVFALYEAYVASSPIIPKVIFASATAIVNFIGVASHGLILWCLLYYFPFYFEAVKGYSPILAGVALLPITFTVSPSAIIVGLMITKTGRYAWAIWSGWALACLGLGLLCLLKTHTGVGGWVCLMLVPGTGLGFLFPAVIYAIQASAKPKHLAMAVAMCSFFRSLGQCLGVAVGGVVFQNRMRAILEGHPVLAPHAAEYSKDAAELVEILRVMSDVPQKEALRAAYTDSLRYVWIFCGALAGASLLLSILTKDYRFEETEEVQVAVRVQSEGQTASYEAKHASQGTDI
ncbi:putative transporter [Aspergillus caelatus]|uniref:Putative transporter n=1 Tax=Aspergillus caelatus TaxID=61420 RepID=A0A5N6ZW98_9EURO|nr:putative transporter [Aspergillus caelatus]KAE8361792.1 putative transporter [Aspergillus caelatus]